MGKIPKKYCFFLGGVPYKMSSPTLSLQNSLDMNSFQDGLDMKAFVEEDLPKYGHIEQFLLCLSLILGKHSGNQQ